MTREKTAARIEELYKGIGNGDEDRANEILSQILLRIEHARQKHPLFAEGSFHALGVIESEFHELEYAIEHESEERQKDEVLDVIATCIRFLCNEHKQEVKNV